MSEIDGDKGVSGPQALVVHAPSAVAPRGGRLALLIALLALLVAAGAAWQGYLLARDRGKDDALAQLTSRVDQLSTQLEQRRRDLEGLRARLGDADSVNKGLREELLALAERVRHGEDAIANLAQQRLSGRDALALNEAEFLLVQAQERLALFHDADAALAAYRLADAALATAEDPSFAAVRRTIGAEREALEAARPADLRTAFDQLDRLRAALVDLSVPTAPPPAAAPASPSRWRSFLDSFVKISHDDGRSAGSHEPAFARALVVLDLRDAQSALLNGDGTHYKAALARVRVGIAAMPGAGSDAGKAALAQVDRLAAMPLAPALPELGSALRELRNLRTTRALSTPALPVAAPHPTGDGP